MLISRFLTKTPGFLLNFFDLPGFDDGKVQKTFLTFWGEKDRIQDLSRLATRAYKSNVKVFSVFKFC